MKLKSKGMAIMAVGTAVIIIAAVVILINSTNVSKKIADSNDALTVLKNSFSEAISGSVIEGGAYSMMPVLNVGENDYIGFVSASSVKASFPVISSWEKSFSAAVPSKYTGSVYNSTLVIGGGEKNGQYDILSELKAGDSVTFTDVTGSVFKYTVSSVENVKKISGDRVSGTAGLRLFAKSPYGFSYVLVTCSVEL